MTVTLAECKKADSLIPPLPPLRTEFVAPPKAGTVSNSCQYLGSAKLLASRFMDVVQSVGLADGSLLTDAGLPKNTRRKIVKKEQELRSKWQFPMPTPSASYAKRRPRPGVEIGDPPQEGEEQADTIGRRMVWLTANAAPA